MKVLLVDDERKFATMLAKRLELRGINVTVCFSGETALEVVTAGNRFDVAVLDVKMPGIGGIELRRRLSDLTPEMKFVFLTGHGSQADYSVGGQEAADYLPKPLKLDALIEILNRLVDGATGSEGDA
jgi:two-component system, OmpR family, response regulator